MARHYIDHYVQDFRRARRVAKHRARNAVLLTAALTALIATFGAISAATSEPAFGVLSTVAAGAIAVIAAREGHYQHKTLWVQRTVVLGRLERLQRTAVLSESKGDTSRETSERLLQVLDEILDDDIASWAEFRSEQLRSDGDQRGPGHLPPAPTT